MPSGRRYEAVGDGGATTAVLLQAIIHQVGPYIAAGGDPVALRRHLDRALAVATEALCTAGQAAERAG